MTKVDLEIDLFLENDTLWIIRVTSMPGEIPVTSQSVTEQKPGVFKALRSHGQRGRGV